MQYVVAILALSALCVAWVYIQKLCAPEEGVESPCGSCTAEERGCVPDAVESPLCKSTLDSSTEV